MECYFECLPYNNIVQSKYLPLPGGKRGLGLIGRTGRAPVKQYICLVHTLRNRKRKKNQKRQANKQTDRQDKQTEERRTDRKTE